MPESRISSLFEAPRQRKGSAPEGLFSAWHAELRRIARARAFEAQARHEGAHREARVAEEHLAGPDQPGTQAARKLVENP